MSKLVLTKSQHAAFEKAAAPLMRFLQDFHPHIEVTVTSTSAEFLMGLAVVHATITSKSESRRMAVLKRAREDRRRVRRLQRRFINTDIEVKVE